MTDSLTTDSLTGVETLAPVVLLVDDQAMIGEAVRRALASEPDIGYHYCSDASEAVSSAEKIAPTVILQDLVMPNIDGLSLLRKYRENPATTGIPVIVLSSEDDPNVKRAAFEAAADDYLVKLPDKIELVARIRHHSQAYINRLQLDAAYSALRESQQKLIEMNKELESLSKLDGLTGLHNRRYLDEFMVTEWRRAVRERSNLSMLMVDVDDFKKYNDTYGHLAGDEVLKKVAATIRHCVQRPADLAARFGGEEFVVILPATPLAGAQGMAEKICRRVRQLAIPHSASSVLPHVTVSIGGSSTLPTRDDSYAAALLKTADVALYEAKAAGKNRVVMHE